MGVQEDVQTVMLRCLAGDFTDNIAARSIVDVYRQYFKYALDNGSSSFVADFYELLSLNIAKDLKQAMEKLALEFTKPKLINLPKVKEEDIALLPDEYMFKLALLNHSTCIGVSEDGAKSFLLTRSATSLMAMMNNGMLDCTPDDLQKKFLPSLVGTKTVNGIKEKKLFAIRLDYAGVNKYGVVKYKPMLPRARFSILHEDEHMTFLLPVIGVYAAVEDLNAYIKSVGCVELNKGIEEKQEVMRVTTDYNLLQRVYNLPDDEMRVRSVFKDVVGAFDFGTLRLNMFNAEASLYDVGLSSVRLEMLNAVKPVEIQNISNQYHALDFDIVRRVFISRIKRMRLADVDSLMIVPDLASYNTLNEKKAVLIEWATKRVSGDVVYNVMLQYANIFGDVNKNIKNMTRAMPKVTQTAVQLNIPDTDTQSIRKYLSSMARKGILTVFIKNKKGYYSKVVGTLNRDLLTRLYGKDYAVKLESVPSRIIDLMDLDLSGGDFETAFTSYGLREIAADKFVALTKSGGIKDPVKCKNVLQDILDTYKEESKYFNSDKVKANLTLRTLYAMDDTDYIRSVAVDGIISVLLSPYPNTAK